MRWSFSITGSSRNCVRLLIGFLLAIAVAGGALADVCVWRDPEKTMKIVFPEAADYKTLTRKISAELRKEIEKRLSAELDPSERKEWASYRIVGKGGKELGRIIACAQKGEYGVIETIMGVTPDGKVKGVYIQRSRERVNKQLKSREFLGQFKDKTVNDPLRIGKDIKGIPGGEKAAEAVAFAVCKMLVLYDKLK